ncbi:tetratricopeptide repeat protein [Marinoscillum pacificum]|uniref:tetratricopeptide repeat protein n=1 Tax=Marinoscillum pacificum TaxID=392723 RepID=UPI0021587681|nr:tetratricopeptide repeat protein [Marinoscillum pacificum]
MKHYLAFFFILISSLVFAQANSYDSLAYDIDNQIKELKEKVNSLTEKENRDDELIQNYQLTNDRINNQLTYISVIATIFGVILALGSIFLGFESLKSNRERKDALATLEEAKAYVNKKKDEFDKLIADKLETIDTEYKKVLNLAKDQLIENIDNETNRVKNIALAKSKEIEEIKVENASEELKLEFDKKIEFLESIGIPDDPDVLKSKIELLRNREMYEEAVKLASKLIEIAPEDHKGYWELAYCNASIGNSDIAIENYEKALKIFPKSSSALNNLGIQFEKTDKLYDALQKIDMAIEINNEESLYHRNRGRILFKLNSPEDAISSYKKSIDLSPDKYFIYSYLIQHLKELERYDEAIEIFDSAISNIEDRNLEINFDKAEFLKEISRFEESKKIFKILIQSNYKTELSYIRISQINFEENNLKDAISSIDDAISLNPKAQYLHQYKIILLFHMGKKDAWQYVSEIGTEFDSEHFFQLLGRKLFEEGMLEDSKKMYVKANKVIQPKLADNNDPDIVNYFEGLIISSGYDESNKFYSEYFPKVKEMNYRLVMQFLQDINSLCEGKINFGDIKLIDIKEYYESSKSKWDFNDILNYISLKDIGESNIKKIKNITFYIKGELSLLDLEAILNPENS